MKTVKLKSYEEIKELVKSGKVEIMRASDSGEVVQYGVKDGGMTHITTVWFSDYDEEVVVVDTDKDVINQAQYERLKILYKEE